LLFFVFIFVFKQKPNARHTTQTTFFLSISRDKHRVPPLTTANIKNPTTRNKKKTINKRVFSLYFFRVEFFFSLCLFFQHSLVSSVLFW